MNKAERASVVRAMDLMVRQVNNEELIVPWFLSGVADGDIDYDDPLGATDEDLAIYYEDDEDFAGLMELFLRVMNNARMNGGLYCDRVVSNK